MLIPGIVLAIAGIVLVVVGKLGAEERLRRNHLIGIRTRSTMASEEAWRAGHRVGAPAIIWAGIAAIVLGLSSAFVDRDSSNGVAVTIAAVIITVALVVMGARNAIRAAKKAEARRLHGEA